MFKIGEKAVFVGSENDTMNLPKVNEIVIIHSKSSVWENSYFIENYLYDKRGLKQSFHIMSLRKLADISETTYNEVMEWIESGKPIEVLN